jgi:hypothetical protein
MGIYMGKSVERREIEFSKEIPQNTVASVETLIKFMKTEK